MSFTFSVLKVYCTRRSRPRESLKNFAERMLEGKRGATAAIRRATEQLSIDLWSGEGFDVVQRVERSLPDSATLPALWLVYYNEPLLWNVLTDLQLSMATELSLAESLGLSLSRRHTRAEELREPLLVHEHGQIKHFFVKGNRLIAFDLEHGFKPGYPVIKAAAREVSGIAYSLVRADEAASDQFLRAFAAGYANKALSQPRRPWQLLPAFGAGASGTFARGRRSFFKLWRVRWCRIRPRHASVLR